SNAISLSPTKRPSHLCGPSPLTKSSPASLAFVNELQIQDTSVCQPSRAEHLLELVGRGDFELIVAAVDRPLVGAPPLKNRGVTEAVPLHVIVLHFADPLDSKRLPGEILSGAPAAL